MKYYEIPKPEKGTRWVIPDIHGCFATFEKVLEEIQLTQGDHLYLLGDYIDRGPGSKEVLDKIMELQDLSFQVFALRGNHENHMLYRWQQYQDTQLKEEYDSLLRFMEVNDTFSLLDKQGKLALKYQYFFDDLPFYFELEEAFLVHAGFDFSSSQPFEDYLQMLLIRGFQVDLKMMKGKHIIHGHTPTVLDDVKWRIKNKTPVITLDNGCFYAYYARKNGVKDDVRNDQSGNLLALNLDSWELLVQPCIDDII